MEEPQDDQEFNDGSPPPPEELNGDEEADKVEPTTSNKIVLLRPTDQVRELQTILRDRYGTLALDVCRQTYLAGQRRIPSLSSTRTALFGL